MDSNVCPSNTENPEGWRNGDRTKTSKRPVFPQRNWFITNFWTDFTQFSDNNWYRKCRPLRIKDVKSVHHPFSYAIRNWFSRSLCIVASSYTDNCDYRRYCCDAVNDLALDKDLVISYPTQIGSKQIARRKPSKDGYPVCAGLCNLSILNYVL
jgi:hypothetical protein